MRTKHYPFSKHAITSLKYFALFLYLFSSLYLIYNIYHIERFHQRYITKIKSVYSYTRRFNSYYNNTQEEYKAANHYKKDNVSLIVNTASQVKVLSNGISKLRSELNQLTNNNIWTIAVLENPADYAHFDPIRPEYLNQFDKYGENSVMQRIVEREGLLNTYQSFYGCNLKLTENYIEDGSQTRIRTLYYPIYNKMHLDALLAIDIKSQFLTDAITQYNNKYLTIINMNTHHNIYKIVELLPCSQSNPMNIGINLLSILNAVFLPSLLLSLFYRYFRIYFIKKKDHFQRDQMTTFYRRDYYEKKWLKQRDFSLLIIDIDFFKNINDTQGHEVGDDVIRHVANRINNRIRTKDIAVRWGGEEFIITFKDMTNEQLHIKAHQICTSIASSPILGLDITVSIGGTTATDTHFNDVYKVADKALYYSKHNGRNQYTIV
ncbi:diguanylate cyclase [Photobacterium aquimaris]|uniref:diguanylate cyclase n=1 Tax=Photobacterium aquimaris TaxID=512643 RepID=A0A2T3IT35_9GAMM|nr:MULTISPECIES: GGDEF domain-containing protein [Photobacterium]OBU18466.1 diguanylate cyclase [Photobacterium aquimaris]OBU20886.1 diguanylate cyclase [Photobacterium aquimaris]PSU31516.1 GGDEF domain-containing protein [Photobacterium aquimaris]PSW03200.1 GGDEF domain-containing protein [Photobacterium aquimaris]